MGVSLGTKQQPGTAGAGEEEEVGARRDGPPFLGTRAGRVFRKTGPPASEHSRFKTSKMGF